MRYLLLMPALLLPGCAGLDPAVIDALKQDPAMVHAEYTVNTPWGPQTATLRRLQPQEFPASIESDGTMTTGYPDRAQAAPPVPVP